MLGYKEKIEAKALTQLSNESAIEWLKANAPNENPGIFSACDNEKLRNIVNFCYYKRNETGLLLAIARYGTHLGTLKKLYRSGDKFVKLAVLTNTLVGPSSFMRENVLSENDALEIISNSDSNREMLNALFENPQTNRDFLEKVVSRKDEYETLEDDRLFYIIIALSKNPIISKQRDDIIMDGYAEYSFNQLNFALVKLLSSVPADQKWAYALGLLIQKIHIPFVPDDITPQLLERWCIEDQGEKEDPMSSFCFSLRIEVARLLFKSHKREKKEMVNPEHKDKAVRLAYYSSAEPRDIFNSNIDGKDFWYHPFSPRGDSEMSKTQKIIVDKCNVLFALDKNDFVEHLIGNINFWKRKEERNFLHDIAWNLAEDKYSSMMCPNTYNWTEERMLKEYPNFFKDEVTGEHVEDQSIDKKLDQIISRLDIIEESIRARQVGAFWKWSVIFLLIIILLKIL